MMAEVVKEAASRHVIVEDANAAVERDSAQIRMAIQGWGATPGIYLVLADHICHTGVQACWVCSLPHQQSWCWTTWSSRTEAWTSCRLLWIAMDGANGKGEKTKKVLLPLIKARKCWSVGNLFNLDNRDDWAALARCSESGKICEIMIMDYGYLRGAAQEDVKKVLDISLSL